MSKPQVKYTAKGELKLKLSIAQYEDFLAFLDYLPEYQRNSYITPHLRLWNITIQRIKDRYLMASYRPGAEQSVTLRMEEALVLKHMYQHSPDDIKGILGGVMMEIDQKVISHA